MGASEWHARVSYQDDIGAALQQARWDAFNRGDYYREPPNDLARSMSEDSYIAQTIAKAQALLPAELAGFELDTDQFRDAWRAGQITPVDPDSLLEAQPFSGTHSVIDMTHVAGAPDYHVVAPASAELLGKVFGTTHPTADAIEAAIEAHRIEGFARWHGMYVIGYDDGKPAAIFFLGWSGD